MSWDHLVRSLTTSLETVAAKVLALIPNIFAFLLLLLAGWVLASLLKSLARRLTQRVLRAVNRNRELHTQVQQAATVRSLPTLIGRIVFWLVLLFFLAAAIDVLGLPAVSSMVGTAAAYLPKVLGGVLIVFVGLWCGELLHGLLQRTIARSGYTELLSRMAQVFVISVSVILAVDQIGINSTILVTILLAVFVTTFGAVALAFGLGARDTVGNILGIHYFRRSFRIGDHIGLAQIDGKVTATTPTTISIETDDGLVTVPGKILNTQQIRLIKDQHESS